MDITSGNTVDTSSFWYWQQPAAISSSEEIAVTTQSSSSNSLTESQVRSVTNSANQYIKEEPSPPSSPGNSKGSLANQLYNSTQIEVPRTEQAETESSSSLNGSSNIPESNNKISTPLVKDGESCSSTVTHQPSSSTTAVVGHSVVSTSSTGYNVKSETENSDGLTASNLILPTISRENTTVESSILPDNPIESEIKEDDDCCTEEDEEFDGHHLTELENPHSSCIDTTSQIPNFHSHLSQQLHHNLQQFHSFRTGALELATLADLSGELAMSLSPKHTANLLNLNNHLHHHHSSLSGITGPHSTPFSVTDILSPLEESYRLKGLTLGNPLDGCGNSVLSHITSGGSSIASNTDSGTPPSPYRVSGSSGSTSLQTTSTANSNNHNISASTTTGLVGGGGSGNSSANNLISLHTLGSNNNNTNSVASANSNSTTIGGNQSPVSSTSSSLSAAAAAAAAAMNVPSSSPYTHMHVPQLSHPSAAAAAFSSQYCNGADLHGMTGHYGDVRSSATAGWYGASATDPRFASESTFSRNVIEISHLILCVHRHSFSLAFFSHDFTFPFSIQKNAMASRSCFILDIKKKC